MRAVVVSEPEPDGDTAATTPADRLELVERERPTPGIEEVLIDVAACGICGGDTAAVADGAATTYPRVPGHEVVGRVVATGERVTAVESGDRVAVGWHAGHCGRCDPCRRGDHTNCPEQRVTAIHRDGGYAEYTTAHRDALARVPDGLAATDAAALVCAGTTAFNALRHGPARPGDTVAVQGIGGVGHLAVQTAAHAGFETVALSRGTDKREAAFEFGADHYVDTTDDDPASRLRELGGADVLLGTAPSRSAIAAVVDGLAPNGQLLLVAPPDGPVPVDVGRLVAGRASVRGWSSGTPVDAEDTFALGVEGALDPVVEQFPLADAAAAYRRTAENRTRFRAVLEP
ncbi:alcohol dehydrogenase catalytic domain-containing protein [Halobaculum sp. MBLA0147]|uniref:alcohol dehydrogenase catalytic domain-containing protein n=1 Tax=Halobaculum sp. MBLA0147 TaxID=3079934 RepID=UPI0035243F02